eukprot:6247243-Prymnesium_polylepis.1
MSDFVRTTHRNEPAAIMPCAPWRSGPPARYLGAATGRGPRARPRGGSSEREKLLFQPNIP